MMIKTALLVSLFAVTFGAPYDGRVVGGENANISDYPYQASLRSLRGTFHFCGGSILNQDWILTAAHCLRGKSPTEVTVVVGSELLSKDGDTYKPSRLFIHENHDPIYKQNDVALIHLSEPIQFNDKVKPINLPDFNIQGDVELQLSGWGRTSFPGSAPAPDHLQQVTVTSTTVEYCQERQGILVTKKNICTSTVGSVGACHGDSGGPLALWGEDERYVVGIVSWGRPCAVGYPDVFTRVYSFLDWITETIQNNP